MIIVIVIVVVIVAAVEMAGYSTNCRNSVKARAGAGRAPTSCNRRNRNPRPRLEPQIVSLENCKIHRILFRSISLLNVWGWGSGVSYSTGESSKPAIAEGSEGRWTETLGGSLVADM